MPDLTLDGVIFWLSLALLPTGLILMPSESPMFGAILTVAGAFGFLYSIRGHIHPGMMATLYGAALFGGAWLLVHVQDIYGPPAAVPTAVPAPPTANRKVIALTVAYEMMQMLPISIKPHSTLYVLPLAPSFASLFYQERNEREDLMWWPWAPHATATAEDVQTPFSAARCDVTNYGEAAMLNVRMDFALQFRKADDPNGPTITSCTHPIVIPAVKPNETFTFYIVNETKLCVVMDFPATATGQVPGEDAPRTVDITRPQRGAVDDVPGWMFLPNPYMDAR